jgi:hypothetical protein
MKISRTTVDYSLSVTWKAGLSLVSGAVVADSLHGSEFHQVFARGVSYGFRLGRTECSELEVGSVWDTSEAAIKVGIKLCRDHTVQLA